MQAAKILAGAMLLAGAANSNCCAAETQYDACINHTGSNVEWGQCGQQEIERQEAHLNTAWKKAYACFDTTTPTERDARQSFLDEQRTWIKWKDAACAFYYPINSQDDGVGFAGREGQVLGAPRCKIAIISDRTRWLEAFTKDCR